MHPKILRFALLPALLALAACSKQAEAPVAQKPSAPPSATVQVVGDKNRSQHFLAVSKHLELGGTLYGYADVDGDALKLAGGMQDFLKAMGQTQPMLAPFASQDLAEIFRMLGVNDVKAVGVSSVPDGTGYFQNRTFFYVPGERHGLMAGLGGKAAPFALVKLAPAGADVYSESEIDMAVVYKTLKAVVAKVGGEVTSNQMETAIKQAGEAAALSLLDLIYGLKGHAAFVLQLDPKENLRFPPGPARPDSVTIPRPNFLLAIENIAAPLESTLKQTGMFKITEADGLKFYESQMPLGLEGLNPLIAVQGSTIFLASSKEFLTQCVQQKSGLADTPEFKTAVAKLGNEGNALGYVSPRFFARVRDFEKLNPNMPAESKSILQTVMKSMPLPDRPLVTVRSNLPDGVLVRSYWNRSLKQDVAMISVYNPITIGLLAAMAIPAFEKVRTSSQDKAILNNLRQLDAAADQYYLENGVRTAKFDDLVGPTKYIRVVNSVMGENYRQLRFVQGEPFRLSLPNGRVIQYPMDQPPANMPMPRPKR